MGSTTDEDSSDWIASTTLIISPSDSNHATDSQHQQLLSDIMHHLAGGQLCTKPNIKM